MESSVTLLQESPVLRSAFSGKTRIIEITGVVGAGKSTVASHLQSTLQARGVAALSLREAIEVCLRRSLLGQIADRTVPVSIRPRLLRITYYRLLDHLYALRFAVANPTLSWLAVRSQMRRSVPLRHRSAILSRFFHVGGRRRYLAPRLRHNELLVVDEGLVHRAIELFGWAHRGPDLDELRTYLEQIPTELPLVIVVSSATTGLTRAQTRGLPRSFSGRSQTEVERFMENSSRILDVVAEVWGDLGRPLVRLDNSAQVDDAAKVPR